VRPVVVLEDVAKSFSIPSVHRSTLREHALARFRRRRRETLRVLEGISLELGQGETLGIMGRNGCGKSTLLKILCGIYPPDRGSVRVEAGLTPILELGVGWNQELDAIDNIQLMGGVMGLTLAAIASQLDAILEFAELEKFANLELKHFSSGMAARLAYSVAFHAVREVLVLDEIFAVGDAGFKLKCETRYRELHAAGHSIVLVSHNPHVIAGFCSRALLLDGGRIAHSGSGAEVAERYLELLAHGAAPQPSA
jgi:ABC-2 type transport system ATP-binding protein